MRERKLKQLATETVNLLCCCARSTLMCGDVLWRDVRDVHLWALIGKSLVLAQYQDWRNSERRRVVCVVCVCGSSDCGIRESFFESYRASGKIVNRLNKSMMIGNWVWRGSGGERWDSSARRMRSIEINCRDQVLDYLERSYLKVTWDLSGNYLEIICNLSQNSF